MASFKSTLEEAADADLLLHVIDISLPEYREQMTIVESVLVDLKINDRPVLKVFNKISDRRTSPIYYIESCGTGIIHKYKVGKSSIQSLGSFHCDNFGWLKDEENYVQVISDIAIDHERCIIPITRKLIELGDYF